MKKVFVVFTFLSCLSLFAGEGYMIVPNWVKNGGQSKATAITMTNISNETVTVFIDVFDSEGNAYFESSETGSANFAVQWEFSGDPADQTNGADLAPGDTGIFVLQNGDTMEGYATIRWESTGKTQDALVGIVRTIDDTDYRGMFALNCGMPF